MLVDVVVFAVVRRLPSSLEGDEDAEVCTSETLDPIAPPSTWANDTTPMLDSQQLLDGPQHHLSLSFFPVQGVISLSSEQKFKHFPPLRCSVQYVINFGAVSVIHKEHVSLQTHLVLFSPVPISNHLFWHTPFGRHSSLVGPPMPRSPPGSLFRINAQQTAERAPVSAQGAYWPYRSVLGSNVPLLKRQLPNSCPATSNQKQSKYNTVKVFDHNIAGIFRSADDRERKKVEANIHPSDRKWSDLPSALDLCAFQLHIATHNAGTELLLIRSACHKAGSEA